MLSLGISGASAMGGARGSGHHRDGFSPPRKGCSPIMGLIPIRFRLYNLAKAAARGPLRYGRRKAVSSLRSGDPQLYDLTRLHVNRYGG